MGSEWLLNIQDRLREGTPPARLKAVDEAIVANASAGDDIIDRRWVKTPFVGEIFSLLAVKDVMYRQTTAVRRRLLNVRYEIAQDRPIQTNASVLNEALPGTTIQIDRSPFKLPGDLLATMSSRPGRRRPSTSSMKAHPVTLGCIGPTKLRRTVR